MDQYIDIIKLDRRHSSYPFMKYYVTPRGYYKEEKIERFIELRNWCWETYGPGVERKYITLHPTDTMLESKNRWAWHTEEDYTRIYLKSDAELTLFKLKWC